MSRDLPKLERLKELLLYDEQSGNFNWRVHRQRVRAGSRAGYVVTDGYRQIKIDGTAYAEHRLAWLYVYGVEPSSLIDHINRNPSDNRIVNLRVVTNSENLQNTQLPSNNTSGFKGVHWNKLQKKWTAKIGIRNKKIYLGVFDSLEEAVSAYRHASDNLHTHAPRSI